jgi:hypothetical protein
MVKGEIPNSNTEESHDGCDDFHGGVVVVVRTFKLQRPTKLGILFNTATLELQNNYHSP